MAISDQGSRLLLDRSDEYPHDPGGDSTYNESMYFNFFDKGGRTGGWLRVGNRPNEGHSEVSLCLYLADGSVAFAYEKAPISDNLRMCAGGMTIEVVEPFRTLTASFKGRVLVLRDPHMIADPKRAYKENPSSECELRLEFTGLSPVHGGELVNADGTAIDLEAEQAFWRAHYEQHCSFEGSYRIGMWETSMEGLAFRDKSWGPRSWQAIDWYRFCPVSFGPDFGMSFAVTGQTGGGVSPVGYVFNEGAIDEISSCEIRSQWDEHGYPSALAATIATSGGRSYYVTGEILSLVPLRSRKTAPNGLELQTRITEGMTRYFCEGRLGYGMSEYLDQLIDEEPAGRAAGH